MLLFPFPFARNKENIETELCKPWIKIRNVLILDRDGNFVNPEQRGELCKPWIETGTM